MFNKKKQIARLQSEKDGLEKSLNNPFIGLAKELQEDVEARFEEGEVLTAIDQAVSERRTRLIKLKASRIAREEARRRITVEQHAIIEAAEQDAQPIVDAAFAKFMADQAEDFRREARERIVHNKSHEIVTAAKTRISDEEREKRIAEEVERQRLEEAETASLRVNKERAHEIRKSTKLSGVLPFGLLQNGDVITVCLTSEGKGHQPLSESDRGWSSRYRSELELRKLTCKLANPDTGSFVVQKDSWFDDDSLRDGFLRGGRTITMGTVNPDTNEYEPSLFKAEPLVINYGDQATDQPRSGVAGQEVWWASLDDYKVLS